MDSHEAAVTSERVGNDDDDDDGVTDSRGELSIRDSQGKASHKGDKKKKQCMNEDEREEDNLVLPSIRDAVGMDEIEDRTVKHAEELVLPPIVNQIEVDSREDELLKVESKEMSLPPLPPSPLEQLEQLTFPLFEDQEDDGNEEGANSDEDNERGISRSGPALAHNLKLDNLPWPLILQYMRESESLISEYFSLKNKGVIESRVAQNKRLQQTLSGDVAVPHNCETSDDAGVLDNGSETETTENEEEEEDEQAKKCQVCDFCGQSSPQVSLLQLAEDQVSPYIL